MSGESPPSGPFYIWQQPDWPKFFWSAEALAAALRACQQAQGRLLGMVDAAARDDQARSELDALLQNIVTSSAIEGERLNVESVRSSLARRLGVAGEPRRPATARSEGLAELTLDATQNVDAPLDLARLLHWHELPFPEQESILPMHVRVGCLRRDEPMQVVSGRIDRPTVHFEAPPRDGLDAQLDAFLAWFNASRDDAAMDPLLRAGVAHLVRHPASVRRRQRSAYARHHRPCASPRREPGHPFLRHVIEHPG